MDIWTKAKRSGVMSRILGKDTKPELLVRKMLTTMGYRYRLNVKSLVGKPDIVMKKFNTVIFVHGCFWHLHTCRDGTVPQSRTEYWNNKLVRNCQRDKKNIRVLRKQGWKVLRLWECDIEKKPEKVLKNIHSIILK